TVHHASDHRLGRFTCGIARTGEKFAITTTLQCHGPATLLAGDVHAWRFGSLSRCLSRQFARIFALWIPGAGHEPAKTSPADDHRTLTFVADLVRLLDLLPDIAHLTRRLLQLCHERLIEGMERRYPIALTLLDL